MRPFRFALRLALLLPRVLLYAAYLACDLEREMRRAAGREWQDTAADGQERTNGRTNSETSDYRQSVI